MTQASGPERGKLIRRFRSVARVSHPLNRHQPDLFQRLVIKRSPIAFHGESLHQPQYKSNYIVV
jgi:hypothetical protein